jgi:hypothetical protein
MPSAAQAELVLLDASVPHRFCDAQLLPELIRYLRDNARVTPEVQDELRRNARREDYAGLRLLERANWPSPTDVLPPEMRVEFEHIRRAVQQLGDPPERHIGEISTVLMAQHLGADLVIMDDDLGKRLVRKKRLSRISTAQLVLEMVVEGALDEAQGLIAFNLSSNSAGEAVFRKRLQERQL